MKTTFSPMARSSICATCGSILAEQQKLVSVAHVIKTVSRFYGVSRADLMMRNRTQHIATIRQIAMYLARSQCGLGYPALGRAFGRDHSSIIQGVRAIERRVRDQPAFAKVLAHLESILNNDERVAA